MKKSNIILAIISIAMIIGTLYYFNIDTEIPSSPRSSHNGYPY